MGLTIEWVDVVKRAGQTAHLASLLLLSTAIKWRRPDNDAPLATVTVPAVLLQLGATLCEYAPLFHPGTRTFRKALGVYEDAVGKISEEASLFDAVLAMMGTVAEQRVAQSCCVAILLCALSGACAYYALQLRLRGAARQRLLQLAVYGACGFAVARLAGAAALADAVAARATLDAVLAAQKLALPLRAVAAFAAVPGASRATRPEAAYLALQGAAIAHKASVALWDAPRDFERALDDGAAAEWLSADPRPATAVLCGLTLAGLVVALRKRPQALGLFVAAAAAFAPAVEAVWGRFGGPATLVGRITSLQLALLLCALTLCGTPLLLFAGLILNALVKLHGVDMN